MAIRVLRGDNRALGLHREVAQGCYAENVYKSGLDSTRFFNLERDRADGSYEARKLVPGTVQLTLAETAPDGTADARSAGADIRNGDWILIVGHQGNKEVAEVRRVEYKDGRTLNIGIGLGLRYDTDSSASTTLRIGVIRAPGTITDPDNPPFADIDYDTIFDNNDNKLYTRSPALYREFVIGDPENRYVPDFGANPSGGNIVTRYFPERQEFSVRSDGLRPLDAHWFMIGVSNYNTFMKGTSSTLSDARRLLNPGQVGDVWLRSSTNLSSSTKYIALQTADGTTSIVREVVEGAGTNEFRISHPLTEEFAGSSTVPNPDTRAIVYEDGAGTPVYYETVSEPIQDIPTYTLHTYYKSQVGDTEEHIRAVGIAPANFNISGRDGSFAEMYINSPALNQLSQTEKIDETNVFFESGLGAFASERNRPRRRHIFSRLTEDDIGYSDEEEGFYFRGGGLYRSCFDSAGNFQCKKIIASVKGFSFQGNNEVNPHYLWTYPNRYNLSPTLYTQGRRTYQLNLNVLALQDRDDEESYDNFRDYLLDYLDTKGVSIRLDLVRRGNHDKVTFVFHNSLLNESTGEVVTAPSLGLGQQGALVTSASLDITGQNPLEVDIKMTVATVSVFIESGVPVAM